MTPSNRPAGISPSQYPLNLPIPPKFQPGNTFGSPVYAKPNSYFNVLVQVSPHNVQGRHVASSPTLFYLAHCELDLTTQLLSANVEAGMLCNVVVLGNSFAQYLERWELKGGGIKAKPGEAKAAVGVAPVASLAAAAATAADTELRRLQGQQQEEEGEASGGAAGAGSASTSSSSGHGSSGSGGRAGPKEAALSAAEGLLYDLCRCGAVREVAVGERGFPVASAFNDMALHTFEPDWRELLAAQRGLL